MNVLAALLFAALVGVAGFYFGEDFGAKDVRWRDHIQARAGIFIDGHDKNKIYDLKLREPQP